VCSFLDKVRVLIGFDERGKQHFLEKKDENRLSIEMIELKLVIYRNSIKRITEVPL
jgi:hypothetical protein